MRDCQLLPPLANQQAEPSAWLSRSKPRRVSTLEREDPSARQHSNATTRRTTVFRRPRELSSHELRTGAGRT